MLGRESVSLANEGAAGFPARPAELAGMGFAPTAVAIVALLGVGLAAAQRRETDAPRTRAVLQVARELSIPIRVPSVVLAEVCRGGARDAAVHRVLAGGIGVIDVNRTIAEKAGALLHRLNRDSRHAVDALVVATATLIGASVIATHDPDDLKRLAARESQVEILAI
ncbi:MAG: PIN domain-containing protein [Myxococcaceae bacterium]|nr:PIN domain-containing protein [Myxococcaceae bacterium]